MSMQDRDRPDAQAVAVDIPFEIYLKGKEEPVHFLTTYRIPTEALGEDKLNDVMQVVVRHVLSTLDTVGEHRLLLSDRRQNKFISLVSDIASISILAPDAQSISTALEQL